MADSDKVIKALQIHADGCGYRSHHCDAMGCPYRYGDESCDIEEMCRDALALLKQEAVVRCKDCQFAEHTMYDDEYRCYFDEENESGCKRLHKGNHFCSDGKRV